MIALLQRVTCASVHIGNTPLCSIETGILALIGIEKDDTDIRAERLAERIIGYRIFPDAEGRMNLDLETIKGELLLVPQFTLTAETRKGMRPGFSSSAPPDIGERLFDSLVHHAENKYNRVKQGRFGADMQVHLVNDGPVTFWLQV